MSGAYSPDRSLTSTKRELSFVSTASVASLKHYFKRLLVNLATTMAAVVDALAASSLQLSPG